MADWTVAASTPTETAQAQVWAMEAHRVAKFKQFWNPYTGQGPNNIIQVDRSLVKEQGDAVNLNLVSHITGAGRGNGATLEGNEVAPSVHSDSVLLFNIRQAIRTDKMSQQRAAFPMRKHMADELSYWWTDKRDQYLFDKLTGVTIQDAAPATMGEAATANSNNLYGGTATSHATITTSDTFTPDLLDKAKTCAEVGILNATTMYPFRPYKVLGVPHYLAVLHNYQIYDLRQTDEWKQAQREANVNGDLNPIFTGAMALHNGVIIREHPRVITTSDAGSGSNLPSAKALFLGLQAGTIIEAQEAPDWVEKSFDYKYKTGFATGMTMGVDKLRYNSIDFAVIAIETYAKNPAA